MRSARRKRRSGSLWKRSAEEASRKGRQVQPSAQQFSRYVIVFTAFLAAEFPAAVVPEWHRLRRRVQLVFKRFKSLAQLGHLPKHNDDSAQAWLCGKLLVALLVGEANLSPAGPGHHRLARFQPEPGPLARPRPVRARALG